jgi:hypothetical protein
LLRVELYVLSVLSRWLFICSTLYERRKRNDG